TVGVRVKKAYRKATLSLGDDMVDFQLPTDVFGATRYVAVRGAGIAFTHDSTQWRGFAGTTAQSVGTPFFRGADWGRAVGMLFVDVPRRSRWRFVSRNAVTTELTSIQGVEWTRTDWLALGASGGIGANRPYYSSSALVERAWMSAQAAYVSP